MHNMLAVAATFRLSCKAKVALHVSFMESCKTGDLSAFYSDLQFNGNLEFEIFASIEESNKSEDFNKSKQISAITSCQITAELIKTKY